MQEPPFKFIQVNGFNGGCIPKVLLQDRFLEVEADQVPGKPVEGEGSTEPGQPQHVEVKGKEHRHPLRYGIMFQPVIGAGRLQVGQEQAPERFLQGRGAEQPERCLSCGIIRDIMEIVKTGIQAEIAFLEAAGALHQLQGRVHTAADEEEPYGRVRVVAWLDAPSGEDPPADMVGKECLYPQLSLVLPLDRRSSCMEQGIDAAWCKKDSHDAGVADLHGLRAQFLDLP